MNSRDTENWPPHSTEWGVRRTRTSTPPTLNASQDGSALTPSEIGISASWTKQGCEGMIQRVQTNNNVDLLKNYKWWLSVVRNTREAWYEWKKRSKLVPKITSVDTDVGLDSREEFICSLDGHHYRNQLLLYTQSKERHKRKQSSPLIRCSSIEYGKALLRRRGGMDWPLKVAVASAHVANTRVLRQLRNICAPFIECALLGCSRCSEWSLLKNSGRVFELLGNGSSKSTG